MSGAAKTMPIQVPYRPRGPWDGCPRSVPWAVVEGHERQAMANHSQTLARLAERGGLGPCELYAIVHDRRWKPNPIPQPDLLAWVKSIAAGDPMSGDTPTDDVELLDLLARVHGDGGHHTDQVGLEQSALDAHRVVDRLRAEVERLGAAHENSRFDGYAQVYFDRVRLRLGKLCDIPNPGCMNMTALAFDAANTIERLTSDLDAAIACEGRAVESRETWRARTEQAEAMSQALQADIERLSARLRESQSSREANREAAVDAMERVAVLEGDLACERQDSTRALAVIDSIKAVFGEDPDSDLDGPALWSAVEGLKDKADACDVLAAELAGYERADNTTSSEEK